MKHISSETVKEYKDLKQQLEKLGYTIKSVTFDGKRGLPKLFKDYPIQMCHFHQKKINVHSGMSKRLRFKMVDEYLTNYKKSDYLSTQILY